MTPDRIRLTGRPDLTHASPNSPREYDRSAAFPAESIRAVHEAGLLTATVGERYGGRGARVEETARILHTLGRGDPSVALITAMTLTPTPARPSADVARGAVRAGAQGVRASGPSSSTTRAWSPSWAPPRGAGCPPPSPAAPRTAGRSADASGS